MSDNKSTGPITAEGKAVSSRNALQHGCCATATHILPHENPADFKTLEATWCRAYSPSTEPERHLVQLLVIADWQLQRVTKAHIDVEAQLYAQSPNPADWTEQQERKLGRHLRYKTAQTNIFLKCRKAVEDYRKARLTENANAEKLNMSRERLATYKQKNKPEQTWTEHLEEMRQKAIRLGFTPPDPTKR
jgi:hypothetical protein